MKGGIGHRPAIGGDQGDRFRGRRRLGLQQTGHRGVGIDPDGFGSLGDKRLALGRRQKRQTGDRFVRRDHGGLENAHQVVGQPGGGLRAEQVGVIHQLTREPAILRGRQHDAQVELGVPLGDAQKRAVDSRQVERTRIALSQHQHDLQGQRLTVAQRAQAVHHPVERRVLVRIGGQIAPADARQQVAETGPAAQAAAQNDHVDEEADQVFQLAPAPPGGRGADRNVVAGAVAVQQGGEAGLKRHEQAGPFLMGEVGQSPGQRGADPQRHLSGGTMAPGTSRGRVVGQCEGARQVAQLADPERLLVVVGLIPLP